MSLRRKMFPIGLLSSNLMAQYGQSFCEVEFKQITSFRMSVLLYTSLLEESQSVTIPTFYFCDWWKIEFLLRYISQGYWPTRVNCHVKEKFQA